MQKSLSYDDEVRLEQMFKDFTKAKNACLSEAEKVESLNDFVTTYRDTDAFESLEQFEEAVKRGDAWDFKCDTSFPEDPQDEADEEDAKRLENGQEPLENGYLYKTTFWQDFTLAERFGFASVEDTFRRAFNEWRTNTIYLTELVLVLNWKIWHWHGIAQDNATKAAEFKNAAAKAKAAAASEKDARKVQEHLTNVGIFTTNAQNAERVAAVADELAQLYNKYWKEADDFACDNLKGAQITYFYNVTD